MVRTRIAPITALVGGAAAPPHRREPAREPTQAGTWPPVSRHHQGDAYQGRYQHRTDAGRSISSGSACLRSLSGSAKIAGGGREIAAAAPGKLSPARRNGKGGGCTRRAIGLYRGHKVLDIEIISCAKVDTSRYFVSSSRGSFRISALAWKSAFTS